jgi:hypothetical protein
MPVIDAAGDQVFDNPNDALLTDDGKQQMGGPPEVKTVPFEEGRTIWKKHFPVGEVVEVDSPELAHKLRCLPDFEEVGDDAPKVEAREEEEPEIDDFGNEVPKAKPKRGRSRKS